MANSNKRTEHLPFGDFLPENSRLPGHALVRSKLLEVLGSQGEILPAADSPLGRLWTLVNATDSSIQQCVEVISSTPALTARVFRLANSAALGGNAKTIAEAVLHLGFGVRQVAFSSHVFDRFSELQLPAGWEHFWMRNLFVAQLVERLASFYFMPTGAEYLSGLLHDAGWLLLATYCPEEFAAVCASPLPLAEAEHEALGLTHADVSAAICVQSNLPLRVVNAVLHHHRPSLPGSANFPPGESASFLGVLLFICDRFADCQRLEMGATVGPRSIDEVIACPEAQWLTHFGKTPDFLDLVGTELAKAEATYSVLST